LEKEVKAAGGAMKISPKKKFALPRRTWQINPVTRVKESSKQYTRPRAKNDWRMQNEQ
jgi:hypothetical protein